MKEYYILKNNFIHIIFLFILIAGIFIGCKEAEPTTPLLSTNENYYPIKEGDESNYKVEILNGTSSFDSIGVHKIYYKGKTTKLNTEYQIRFDSLSTNVANANGISYLRSSAKGVYGFADTSGLTLFLPDSIKRLLSIDAEQNLFSLPVQIGREWICYSVSLPFLSIVDFRASMIKKENVDFMVKGVPKNLEALKVNYSLKLNIIGIDSSITSQEFYGTGWFVNEFGMVKYEGAQEILSAVSSAVYQLPGSSVKVRVQRID